MLRQIESKTIFGADDKVSPTVKKIVKNLSPLSSQLSKVGNSLKDFGSSALFKSGAGLGSVFLGAIKPAMEFEKSMAQVYKTFDPARIGISEKSFSKTVRNMSSGMGIMATQMADIFENMPLPEILSLEGVSSAEKYKGIMNMAEMTAMALTTMGLEAGDAGDKMKSMFNVLGGKDINKVIQTMNAVNEMGNQFGVKPADTLEFLTRQGALGLGNTAKLTNLETTAVGGTMLGFGATPETAKTSFQKMINVGQAYTSATNKQVEAFKKLGTSAKQFAEYWQNSPTDAIIDILKRAKGLKDIEVTPVFKELFGVEGSVNIKTMMSNLDGFVKKLKLVNDEQAINNSVFNEFKKLSKTSSFAVDKMKSSLNNLGIVLGDALLPTVTKIADKISEWTKKYEKLSPETKKMIGDTLLITTGLLALGVAVGGVSFALGGLVTAMGVASRASKLMGGFDMLGMIGGFGGKNKTMKNGMIPANSNTLMKKMKMPQVIGNNLGVNMLSDFGGKPANANNKLGFFKKLSNLALTTAGAFSFLGINSKNLFSVLRVGAGIFSRFVLPVGIVVGLAEGISKKWNEIGDMFDKIGNKLNVLADSFGLGGAGGAIKSGASAIADWLGDTIGNTIVGLLDMLDRLIYGLAFSANLAKTKSWSAAGALTDEMIKQQSMSPKEKETQLNDIGELKRAIMSMPFGNSDATKIKEQIVKVDVVIEDHQTRVVRNGITLQTVNTGKTSTPTITKSPTQEYFNKYGTYK
jgi:TP901 family phage tail tape measure protein